MSNSVSSCACEPQPVWYNTETFKKGMVILEKISLVALAIFAATLIPKLFFSFCGAGVAVGTVLYWNNKAHCGEAGKGSIGCSQGFMEQLTGVKLPPPLGLGVNVAILACHLDHHSTVFVPLVGLNFGMWIGKFAGENIPLWYHKFTQEHVDAASAA